MRILLALSLLTIACSDPEPVKVVSSTLTGSVDGDELSAVYGVINTLDSGTVSIAVGTGKLDCSSQTNSNPPGSGIYMNLQLPELVTGTPSEHFFQFFVIAGGDLSSRGSSGGSVNVDAITPETVSLTVDYDELLDDASYRAMGSVEVVLCD